MGIPFEVNNELAFSDPEGWNTVSSEKITEQSRWSTYFERVISNGEIYYQINWSCGSTECQWQDDNYVEITQVYPKTVSTVIYVENPDA